ncbi:MAG TPA: vWA domain-containing protein, partial [Methylomirabilota bacterium]|nr:vWA domain-containing protein [Methylomirabilota bacterium]
RQTIDMFCIGMGFKAPMFWTDVELSHDQEHIFHKAEKRIHVGLVCDLLALSEILPNDAELTEFKQKLDQKWSIHTKQIFDKATIKEDVYTQLKQYIQEELYNSATHNLHKGIYYRINTWISAGTKTVERHSLLIRLSNSLSNHIMKKEEKNKNVSQAAAARYFESIIKLASNNFIKNQKKYVHLIEHHLNQFIQTYIRSVLRALTLGFDIAELVAYLDEDKAIKLAKQIYDDLDTEVRNNIALAWMDNRKSLFLSRRSIGASLDKKLTKQLTERCIQKCGWSILKPLIHRTVLNMFTEQFEIQAKEALPYWIRLASTREVTRSIRQISNMLPDVIGHQIYSQEVMFGTTPFREALDRASIRLLDKAYKNREKVLIVISDGEFEERQSALLSADLLKQRGVTIISCLVADKNIVTQLIEQFKGTRSGAQLMFEIASEANKKVQVVPGNKDQKTTSTWRLK